MQVTETVVVTREIHVAPCLECGHTDILLSDSGYSSFNVGGGKCKKCGNEVSGSVSCIPTMTDLASIWNAENDVAKLIAAERAKIEDAQQRIIELEVKAGVLYTKPFSADEMANVMTVEAYMDALDRDFISSADGKGYWSSATGKSDISTRKKQPAWATHVLWLSN